MVDTLDVLSPDEARMALNLARNDQLGARPLASLVTAVSRRFDALCGPIVQRTITGERHDGCDRVIFPRLTPVASITTVTEYDGTTGTVLTAETPGTQPTNGYLLDPVTYGIWRRSGGADVFWHSGRSNVTITYVAGRAANTAAVAPQFKEAVGITLAHIWRNEHGMQTGIGADGEFSFASFSVPNRAMELVAGERLVPGIA